MFGAEILPFAQAPLAAAAGPLNPTDAHPIAYFSGCNAETDCNHFTYRFVAEDSRKLARQMAERLMHIRVADSAGVQLYEDLTGTGFRLRHILHFPWTTHRSHNCC
jgi:hypothetical protein